MNKQTGIQPRPSAGLTISGAVTPAYATILTPDALVFVEDLVRRFAPRVRELLARRVERQQRLDAGELPDFLPETAAQRAGDWTVAPIPPVLLDRRVEITGPVDRKMIINALNSGARVFMADFEDASSPTWQIMMDGQVNVRDAVAGTIQWTAPSGRNYKLNSRTAVLMVRPRGWHMIEAHARVDGDPVPAALWDFGLFFFHNARALMARGDGPYLYLPKMQSHPEARLWNDVFVHAQEALGIPRGTIRATVLIETILAAFEMDEILYELREHAAGLNCGRWDFIFSWIKCFRRHPQFMLPDRSQVSMSTHFMSSYSLLLIQTCHRRGVHAMGGMAAQIPIKDDAAANEMAMLKVRKDKEREARNGHDGSWVSHPALVPLCEEIYNQYMPGPNQIGRKLEDVCITREDLLKVPEGAITSRGLMENVSAALRYTESWLGGQGSVPLYNLMEDAATAEIARAQLWQWCHFPGGRLDDGRKITVPYVHELIAHELESIRLQFGTEHFAAHKYRLAAQLLERMIASELLPDFLTTEAYEHLLRQ
ncbi:MAG: malate synthase A [Gammaproteobacteria bacterium]|nr:malate synthase A [Gammaproteobacteria bacterium]